MSNYSFKIELLSDTTFGRGDGVAGLIDQEVEHDPYGFPYLRGRTLKGLISEECDNLVFLLPESQRNDWLKIRKDLFGTPGSTAETMAKMHIGDACLPEDLRQAVALQFEQENTLSTGDILSSLTTFRRQTSIDPEDGIAKERSLRSSRVILRELCFTAPISLNLDPVDDVNKTRSLLGVGALALRRLGSGRNRGRGHVKCTLWEETKEITPECLRYFEQTTKI